MHQPSLINLFLPCICTGTAYIPRIMSSLKFSITFFFVLPPYIVWLEILKTQARANLFSSGTFYGHLTLVH